ncbi:hypothetical protein [Streptomyces umbrinus]|uniref:hypothetical protein n=1 Tax=Streptomyces umbrinus TaxID=67370 RepID=UPI003C2E2FAB
MEIFRFVSLRPPQLVSSASVAERGVRVYEHPSDFLGELAELRNEENARARMMARAQSRLSEPVLDHDREILDVVARVDDWLVGRHSPVSAEELRRFVGTSSGATPRELVDRDAFHSAAAVLADWLLAALLVASPSQGPQLDTLVRRIRTRAVIQLLAEDDAASDVAVHERLRAVVFLPRGTLPVPSAESEPEDTGEGKIANAEDIEVELRRTRHARDLVVELVQWQPLLNTAAKKQSSAKLRRTRHARDLVVELVQWQPLLNAAAKKQSSAKPKGPETAPFVLTRAALDRLDDDAAAVLAEQALDPATMSAPSIVASLERRIRTLAKQHPSPVARRPISVIGTHPVPADVFYTEGGSGSRNRQPGPCQSGQPVTQEPTTTTVPTSIGVVRVAGIGDLLKVEQTTRRYEMGEIAHIENVLASERRVRTHQRSDTTEETFLTQVETTDESERDLVSTDRFELQKETAAVIATDASKDVGITINASYGPTVDATLNSNFATSTSTENSSRTSTAFARETTDRSVARLTRRTLETRTRRTLTEIVETNKHGFRNDDPQATNISGVYRWVDKVYESNLVRYGRRLFVECVIPEPAAFIRYADARRASQLPDIQRPDPPGYCVDGRFEPLTAEDLDEETYLDWVAAYELTDLAPPPSALKVIGLPIEYTMDAASSPTVTTKITTELIVPPGYLGVSASTSDLADVETMLGGGSVFFNPFIAIGGSVIRVLPEEEREPAVPLYNIEGALPISIWVLGGMPYCFNVIVCCARAPETLQKWQIDTYTSIMGAYHTMLAEYNERLSALDIGAMQIRGRNPLLAREIERTELKRLSIEMMTDQHFEAFDSTGTDALGYPSPDVADADREGRYIQFFEQMFEWTNMTYVFYPYFWSRKAQWPALAVLDDTDPLFARFLQAGAARVQIPVRPGYESALTYFIESGGAIWEGGDPPHIDDPMYVSLIDEIRAIEGVGNASVGPGLISATAGSATATGVGTQFEQSDVGRQIDIGTDRFVIREVVSAGEIRLGPVPGSNATDVEYSLGGWYVGPPWEVRLPTSLVALQGDSTLPSWPSDRPTP